MRNKFENQLAALHTNLVEMGALLEQSISAVSKSLKEQKIDAAEYASVVEKETDEKERIIEALCMKMLQQQQPVAGDLRIISAALKMVTDMERIGDQIADVAEIMRFLEGTPYIKKLESIPQMGETASVMLKKSLDAFVSGDVVLAREAIALDDKIDELFAAVKRELTNIIQSGKSDCSQALDFLMIAKYYERIGDHIVNVAEWVCYSVTGAHGA